MIREIVRCFVEPEAGPVAVDEPTAIAGGVTTATLAVVCGADDGHVVGAGFALALRAISASRCALVAGWRCAPGPGPALVAPAAPAARRLADTLGRRGLEGATASGRLARLRLPLPEDEASVAAQRALAAASGVPAVLVVAGPRTAAFDELLAEQDRVVVVTSGADPELAEVALASLAGRRCRRRLQARAGSCGRSAGGGRRRLDAGAANRVASGDSGDVVSERAVERPRSQHGQALVLLVGAMMALLAGALVLGGIASGLGARVDRQGAADLAALAAARRMRNDYVRLFEPPFLGGRRNPAHLELPAYLATARGAAERTARSNGAADVRVTFPDRDPIAPTRIRVVIAGAIVVRGGPRVPLTVAAEAEMSPETSVSGGASAADEYPGPFALRQGKPMRPDVAQAFDRMAAAAHGDGFELVVVSAFRTECRAGGALRGASRSGMGRAARHLASQAWHRA